MQVPASPFQSIKHCFFSFQNHYFKRTVISKRLASTMARGILLGLLVVVFLFCLLEVSSDFEMEGGITISQLVVRGGNRRLMQDIDCGGLCKERCSLNSRPKVCIRACGTCCLRCKCVPPGTSGNTQVCGKCYTDMTTHGNKTKCP